MKQLNPKHTNFWSGKEEGKIDNFLYIVHIYVKAQYVVQQTRVNLL